MKRILAFLLSFSVILTCIGGLSISVFAEGTLQGSGTAEDPYLISSAADFALIANDLTADYKQTADFTVTTPITGIFKGTYNGDGHTITLDLKNTSGATSYGLFYQAQGTSSSNPAVFEKIILRGSVVTTGIGGTAGYTGALLGAAKGGHLKIKNVTNYADVSTDGTSSSNNTGGIAGRIFYTSIEMADCVNYGTVSGKGYTAGIVAMFGNGTTNVTDNSERDTNKILRCANFGNVEKATTGGGICGWSYSVTIDSCYNAGVISGDVIAGIHPLIARQALVTNCFNMGALKGTTTAGIMKTTCSATYTQNVVNCYNISACTGAVIVSKETLTSVENVKTLFKGTKDHSGVTVVTAAELEGLALSDAFTTLAENEDNEEYYKAYPYPQLKENPLPLDFVYVEGLGTEEAPYLINDEKQFAKIAKDPSAHYKQMANITNVTAPIATFSGVYDGNNCSIDVNLTTSENKSATGFGLFCTGTNATIRNLTVTGSVTNTCTTEAQKVGAIVGFANGPVTIDNCVNRADVSITKSASAAEAGGILGRCYKNTINVTNCKNYGAISVKTGYAAGIVGMGGNGGEGTVSDCANFGEVTCGSSAAGIIALAYMGATNSYNFGRISSTSDYGIAAGIQASMGGSVAGNITNCFNAGIITGQNVAAIGVNTHATTALNINNSYSFTNNIPVAVATKAGPLNVANCYTTYEDDAYADKGVTVVTKAVLKETVISDAFTTLNENSENASYNAAYPYPQLKNNLIPTNYEYVEPLEGSGTEGDPYIVTSASDLAKVKHFPDAYFKQQGNIEGVTEMIGLTKANPFFGKYDGAGYTIDIAITSEDSELADDNVGTALFPFIAEKAEICNLTITGTVDSHTINTAAFVGVVLDTDANSASNNYNLNGLVNYATINSDKKDVAGIIGRGYKKGSISNCYNYGNITTTTNSASGIVAVINQNVTISGCGNYGDIKGVSNAAGISAWIYGNITNSFNVGKITAASKAAGIAGQVQATTNKNTGKPQYQSKITDCYNAGTLIADETYGISYRGSGKTQGYTISGCYNAVSATYPISDLTDEEINELNAGWESDGDKYLVAVTDCYYLTTSEKESVNAGATKVTSLEDLKAITFISEAYAKSGDYQYPQLATNKLDEDKDDIDFVLLSRNVSALENTSVFFNDLANNSYIQKGDQIVLVIIPNEFYTVEALKGEGSLGIFTEKTEVLLDITSDTVITAIEAAVEIVQPENVQTAADIFTTKTAEDVVTVGGKDYDRFAIVAGRVEQGAGLKVQEFGVLINKADEEFDLATTGTVKATADAMKINETGWYGMLIYGDSDKGLKDGVTYYTRPYAIYADKDGNTYTVYGNVQSFVLDAKE